MNKGQMDCGNENPTQNLHWWLRKTTKKPQSGWSAPGFEPGTSRMRVSCIITEIGALRRFTYVTAHSPTFPSLYLRHSSFSNSSVASPMSQLILQPLSRFSYITSSAHSPTFPSLHLRHNSFYNPSVALPTSQFILQPFRCFTYVTVHYPTLPLLHLHHSSFSNPLSLLLHHKLFT